MNNSLDLESTKIFNDYHTFMVGQKKSALLKIYKSILIAFFVLSTFFLLIFIERTFFAAGNIMFQGWKINDFLSYETLKNQQRNTMIMIRFALLAFVFFYSISKNYINIYFQKETIKKYWPWFTAYLSYSVIAFGLLFGFFTNSPAKLSYLFLILIPLYVLNLSYAIYLYFLKKKTDPNSYNNKISLMIGLISQSLLVVLTLALMSAWVAAAKDGISIDENLYNANSFYTFWQNLFTTRKTGNLMLILLFTIILTSLLIGVNADKISFLFFKQNKQEYFKDKILITLGVLTAILAWTIRVLFYKVNTTSVLGNSLETYTYLLEILFGAIIFSLFTISQFVKKIKTNSQIVNATNHVFAQSLLWISLFTITLLNRQNTLVNLINTFFVSAFSYAMLVIYFIKNTNYSFLTTTLLRLAIIVNALVLIIFNINQILIANKNYIFLTIDSNLYLTQIVLVVCGIVWFAFLITTIASLILVANKITYFKKRVRSENEK
ncbi:MSC_0624 family F1-like ATPase-associated membrane protein [Metamycoplasma buccale]|uniref:MSC_0624 family F1-like ATPase-associated membrane protein n=1 Tax=Metamycoplasma buccale TaxID=55602 RepID=UPI00398F0CE4